MSLGYQCRVPPQVKGMGGEEPALAESRADVSLQERSAETEGAQQPPEAVQSSIDPVLESPKETAHLSEVAASSTSPSLSPQPLQQLHEWASHEQLAQVVPSRAAPAAQAAAPAAQNDGTWQEVRGHRRRSVRQQGTSHDSARRAPQEGRGAPGEGTSAPSPSRPREAQAAARRAELGPRASETALVPPPHAELVHATAENLPQWMPALTGSQPERPSQHEGLMSLQPPRPQPTLANSMSHRPLQASTDSTSQDGDHAAPQRMLDPPEPEIFSHEHVCLALSNVFGFSLHVSASSISTILHQCCIYVVCVTPCLRRREAIRCSADHEGANMRLQAAHTNEGLSGEDNQQGDYLCVVCMENAQKIVFCDCGHLVRFAFYALLMCCLYVVREYMIGEHLPDLHITLLVRCPAHTVLENPAVAPGLCLHMLSSLSGTMN